MKILVVQETDWIDRNPILHHRMLESLALAGDEVVVLDHDIRWRSKGRRPLIERRREVRDVAKFQAGSGVVVIRPAMVRLPGLARPTWLATTTLELVRLLRRWRPDVVLGYGLSNAFVAQLLAARTGVPFVFHIFDALHRLAEPGGLRPAAQLVEAAVLRSARAVIVGHRGLLDYVRAMGVPPARIRLILNGFQVRRVDPRRTRALRAELEIGPDEVVLVFVGFLYAHSGLLEVARALVEQDRYRGFRLLVAGDGDLLADLRTLARDAPHGDRLTVLGRVPVARIPEIIAIGDVGLHVSVPTALMRDVVPAKVDEYLELGRPVLATRLPGMVAELGDLESVLWVDGPDDALPRLLAAVAGGRSPRARLRRLGAGSRAYARRREAWPTVTARFRETLAAARSLPSPTRRFRLPTRQPASRVAASTVRPADDR